MTDTKSVVPVLASVTVSPPAITLNFPRAGIYQIFRKDPAATTWGTALVTQTAVSSSWTDTTVNVGQLYEYKCIMTDGTVQLQIPAPVPLYKTTSNNSPPIGYIMTGIQVDETQPKGRVALVVTTDVQANLPAELAQYQSDLAADGWFVHVIPVAPTASYTSNGTGALDANGFPTGPFPTAHIDLRNQIIALYNQYPGQVKNVILLGRVPVCRTGSVEPYTSGANTYYYLVGDPDGHEINKSCYGADGYYANMTGTWTDTLTNGNLLYKTVNGTTTGDSAVTVAAGTLNVPGDNKFDQFYMSETGGQADMGFGRIDLSNGIADQYEAIRFYLNKLHRYKTASPDFIVGRRTALRGNTYCNEDETFWTAAPAISGSLAPIDLVTSLPAVESSNFDADAAYTAQNGPYAMYLKGSGNVGVSTGGKAMMWTGMQSHWGWWYSTGITSGENTFALRLGEDSYCLSIVWNIFGLRYFYHRMSMGFDTGDMMRVSINNTDATNGIYAWTTDPNGLDGGYIASAAGGLFMDHFGDPTVHLYVFAPPTNLSVVPSGGNATLSWTASPEPALLGYHVYRQDSATAPFVRLTSAPVAGTSYVDGSVSSGAHTYMVRAVKLETTGGGTFYNASLGAQQSIDLTAGPAVLAISTPSVLPDVYWNTLYTTALTAQGGTPNYTWSLLGGTVPPGLTLNANGTFAGLATQGGNYAFTAQVTDALGQVKQLAFTVTAQNNNTVTLRAEESAFVYSTAATRVQGPIETMNVEGVYPLYVSYLRFNLAGLNVHNSFVSAKLRLYIVPGTTTSAIALVQASLSDDAAGAAWLCSAMSYNTQPADNPSIAPVLATSGAVPYTYLDLDVTPLLAKALTSNASRKMSLRLSTATQNLIAMTSSYGYGNARPQLIVQTTDAPLITLTAPTFNPAYLYAGSAIQFNATVTPIAARANYLTTQWSLVSGPGTATFSTPGLSSTGVTFSTKGDYVIRLTANDGLLTSYRDTTVRVLTAAATGPTDSLALRLPFDEGSGTTAHDASGATPPNNGTANGATAPTWTTTGAVAGAITFDGTGQRVDVPDSATNLLDGTAQISISCWVYANALPASGVYTNLISKRITSPFKESYTVQLRGSQIYLDVAGSTSLIGTQTLVSQTWTHIVLVYTGGGTNNLRLFINGIPDKYTTVTPTTVPRNPTANLHIGAYDTNATGGFNGSVDEVRIYTRALTVAEVQDLYQGAPSNLAPVISLASSSVTGSAGQPFNLGATVTDDGKPAAFTLQWLKAGGPGTIAFGTPTAATTTGTASLSGTYTLQLAVSDGAVTTYANVTASIAQTYTGWTNQYNLSGTNAADGANPAGDGVVNLLKYAFGLDPTKASVTGLPVVSKLIGSDDNKPHLAITYRRRLNTSTELTYAVQVSDDLLGWDGSGSQVEQVGVATPTGDGITEQVVIRLKAALPVDGTMPRKFLRVQVARVGGG